MLLSIKKSWGIFPIKQKFNTMAAYSNQKINTIVQNCYNEKGNLHNGSKFGGRNYSGFKIFTKYKNSHCIKFLFHWKDSS